MAGIVPRWAAGPRRPAWQPAVLALLPVLGLHAALLLGSQGLQPRPGPAAAWQPAGVLPAKLPPPVLVRVADTGKAPAPPPARPESAARRLTAGPARAPAAGTAAAPARGHGAADAGPAQGGGLRTAGLLPPLPGGPALLEDHPAVRSASPPAPPGPSLPPVSVPAPAQLVAESEPDLAAPEPALLQPPPLYATLLPPAARLQYRLRRGAVEMPATLDWQPDGEHYRLRLQGDGGEAAGAAGGAAGAARAPMALGWASQGALGAQGLAPQRHAEVHRGRERRAVNFQRDAGLVTYSAPLPAHPLLPGTQDRLSWLVQLAGVLQANPGLAEPGGTLQLLVVGTRGQPQMWHFDVRARLTDAVPPVLHLRREPTHPYDVQVDIWLDPAQHHWPQRVRWLQPGSGQVQELQRVGGAAW